VPPSSAPKTLAKAIRVELQDGKVFVVFEVCDADFERQVRTRWLDDVELEVVDKALVKK